MYSPAGNRTPVSRVTGRDTHHYTTILHSLQRFPQLQIAHGHTDTLSSVICVRLANLARYRTQMQKLCFN